MATDQPVLLDNGTALNRFTPLATQTFAIEEAWVDCPHSNHGWKWKRSGGGGYRMRVEVGGVDSSGVAGLD